MAELLLSRLARLLLEATVIEEIESEDHSQSDANNARMDVIADMDHNHALEIRHLKYKLCGKDTKIAALTDEQRRLRIINGTLCEEQRRLWIITSALCGGLVVYVAYQFWKENKRREARANEANQADE